MYCRGLLVLLLVYGKGWSFKLQAHSSKSAVAPSDQTEESCFFGIPLILCRNRCRNSSLIAYCEEGTDLCKCRQSTDYDQNLRKSPDHLLLQFSSLSKYPDNWEFESLNELEEVDDIQKNKSDTVPSNTNATDTPHQFQSTFFLLSFDFSRIFGFNGTSADINDFSYAPSGSLIGKQTTNLQSAEMGGDWNIIVYAVILVVILGCLFVLLLVSSHRKKRQEQINAQGNFKTVSASLNK